MCRNYSQTCADCDDGVMVCRDEVVCKSCTTALMVDDE